MTPTRLEEAIDHYKSGVPNKKVAVQLQVGKAILRSELLARGLMKPRITLSDADKRIIALLKRKGHSAEEIAAHFEGTCSAIWKVLKAEEELAS